MELRDCVMEGVAAQMSYMARAHLVFAHVPARLRGVRGTLGGASSGASADATLKKKNAPHREAVSCFSPAWPSALRAGLGSPYPVSSRVPGEKKKDRREATVRDGAPESNRMRAHVRAARACVALRDSSPSPVARYPPVPLSSVRSGLEPQWTERRLPDRRPSASHVASRDAGRRHGAACRVAPSRPSYRT